MLHFFVARRFSNHLWHFAVFCGILRRFLAFSGVFWCFPAFPGIFWRFLVFSGVFWRVGDKFPLRDQIFGGAQTPTPFSGGLKIIVPKWGGSGLRSPPKTFFLFFSREFRL